MMLLFFFFYRKYGKCPKILNAKVSDKMAYANRADPDQTVPEEAIKVYPVCHSTKYFRNNCIKSKI